MPWGLRYITKLERLPLAAETGSKLTSVRLAKSQRLCSFGVQNSEVRDPNRELNFVWKVTCQSTSNRKGMHMLAWQPSMPPSVTIRTESFQLWKLIFYIIVRHHLKNQKLNGKKVSALCGFVSYWKHNWILTQIKICLRSPVAWLVTTLTIGNGLKQNFMSLEDLMVMPHSGTYNWGIWPRRVLLTLNTNVFTVLGCFKILLRCPALKAIRLTTPGQQGSKPWTLLSSADYCSLSSFFLLVSPPLSHHSAGVSCIEDVFVLWLLSSALAWWSLSTIWVLLLFLRSGWRWEEKPTLRWGPVGHSIWIFALPYHQASNLGLVACYGL
jgi:hypothetical protein